MHCADDCDPGNPGRGGDSGWARCGRGIAFTLFTATDLFLGRRAGG